LLGYPARLATNGSSRKQHGHRGSVEDALCHTSQQQLPDTAGAPHPNDQQLRIRSVHDGHQFAQRFAGPQLGASPPSAALELRGGAVQRLRCRLGPFSIDASDFAGERRPDAADAVTSVTRPSGGGASLATSSTAR
jgi:hypothetical protein